MSYVKYFVEHYDKLTDTTWDTDYTLLDAFDVNIKRAIGEKSNIFSFKLLNVNNKYSTMIEPGDKIVFYGVKNSDTYTTSNLLMAAVVKTVSPTLESKSEIIIVEGVDYSEAIMSGLVFASQDEGDAMQFLKLAIASLNRKNEVSNPSDRFYLKWNSDNPTKKSDNTSFPTLYNINEMYKSALSVISTYLSNEKLEDGDYFWYVNINNEFVVRKKTDSVSSIDGTPISLSEGTDFNSFKIGKDISNVKNYVIYKAGIDPSGKVIQGKADNAVSRVKNGFKPYIMILDTANALFEKEKTANPDSFEVGSQMLISGAYPYTTDWKSSMTDSDNAPHVTKGSQVVVTTPSEWVYAFRREVDHQSYTKANNFIYLYANGFFTIHAELPINFSYSEGQLIKFNSARYGFVDKLLRIHEVNFDITGVNLKLQEDEATI